MKKLIISLLIVSHAVLLGQHRIYGVVHFDSLVVTASRIPQHFTETNRSVGIISDEDINDATTLSVPDLLENVSGVDVKSRGAWGVQSDVCIRGASYEETLVMVDGVKITDSQTGHHNMDIPIPKSGIEKIEILKGSGSRLFGPNAFGGVVNIITKKNDKPSAKIDLAGGSYSQYDASVFTAFPLGSVSLSRSHSDGYRHNTDYDHRAAFGKLRLKNLQNDFNLNVGYKDNAFGANQFYSAKYPDQWEETRTWLISGDYYRETFWGNLNSTISYRHHNDHYILIKDNPAAYENFHRTKNLTAEIQTTKPGKRVDLNMGAEMSLDSIHSNNLGKHLRSRGGLFGEANYTQEKFSVITGMSAYYYSSQGLEYFPGIDIGYDLTENTRLTSSVGRSFRIPTYTEMYYQSPTDSGNPALKPETAWSTDLALKNRNAFMGSEIGIFCRMGNNLIDWAKRNGEDCWRAINLVDVNTVGFELTLSFNKDALDKLPYFTYMNLAYTWLHNDFEVDDEYNSRYLLNSLNHQLVFDATGKLFAEIYQTWKVKYEDREFDKGHWIIDMELARYFKRYKVFLSVNNLLNVEYHEFESIPAPGRWIRGGVSVEF